MYTFTHVFTYLRLIHCSIRSSLNTKYNLALINFFKDYIMWTTPAATEMRFGFEVTMYVMNK